MPWGQQGSGQRGSGGGGGPERPPPHSSGPSPVSPQPPSHRQQVLDSAVGVVVAGAQCSHNPLPFIPHRHDLRQHRLILRARHCQSCVSAGPGTPPAPRPPPPLSLPSTSTARNFKDPHLSVPFSHLGTPKASSMTPPPFLHPHSRPYPPPLPEPSPCQGPPHAENPTPPPFWGLQVSRPLGSLHIPSPHALPPLPLTQGTPIPPHPAPPSTHRGWRRHQPSAPHYLGGEQSCGFKREMWQPRPFWELRGTAGPRKTPCGPPTPPLMLTQPQPPLCCSSPTPCSLC